MRNLLRAASVTFLATIVLAVTSAAWAAGGPEKSGRGVAAPPRHGTNSVVLYDQNDNLSTLATLSANFTDFPTFSAATADDFVVPGGQSWSITEVAVAGTYFNGAGPATDVDVIFYADSAGLPGAPVCTYTNQPYSNDPNYDVLLPAPCLLTSGTYWMSVAANLTFATEGEWGWFDRTVQSNNPAAWENPGGGFGVCPTWQPKLATCVPTAGGPDQPFTIYGDIVSSGCNGVWLAATPIPYDLARYAFVQNGDNLYVIGGVSDGIVTSNMSVFNADTNTWTPLAPIPASGEAPTAGIFNGKIYVAGGFGINNLSIYDIASNTWTSGAPIPISTYGAAGGAFNGLFYVAGGTMGTDLQVYDIATNTWTTGAAVPTSYYLGGYTVLGQYLYIVGSFGTAPMGARAGSSLVGGHGSPVNSPDANDTETIRLDMSNGTWSSGPPWPMQRADMALASDGFSLYAIGGDITGGGFFDGSAEMDQLDLSAWPGGTWVVSPSSLPSPRQANQAGFFSSSALFNSGEIWSSGGVTPNIGAFLDEHLYLGVCTSCSFTYNITVGSGSIVPGTVDIGNHCDDCTTAVALPFPFNFHGTPYSLVNADSNGTLQFASSTSMFTNTCLPNASFSDAIFPYWDDLYLVNAGFGIFTSTSGSAPNRIFNIEWRSQFFPGTGSNNFEVRLYETGGQIDVIYGDDGGFNGASATAGLQVGDGSTTFLQYECNTGGLTNGLMLTYARAPLTPVITPSGPTTFCQGGSVTLDAGAGYASYSWTPNGETTQTIVASATGSYDVTVTDSCGNSGTAPPVVVTANPNPTPTITPSGPTTFCAGGSVTLDAGAGYSSYLWSPGGATTQTIVVNASGSYSVTVTDSNGCSGSAGPTVVTVNPLPTPTITPSGPTSFCAPGSVTLDAGAGYAAYLWSPGGATTQTIVVSSSGSYTVMVTDGNGCVGTSAPTVVTVNATPAPVITVNRCLPPNTPGNIASVPGNAGDAYVWTITGGTIDSGQGTASISFTSGPVAQFMTLSIDETSSAGCLGSAGETMQVNFADVPASNPFYTFICKLARNSITGGCGGGNYCPAASVLRSQMAVFLLRSEHGPTYVPPACTVPSFGDVPCSNPFSSWIYQLVAEGITGGCGGGNFCPNNAVLRNSMAVFLLVTEHGTGYTPPACTPPGQFTDVPCPGSGFTDWIYQLVAEGITGGCTATTYCPTQAVSRAQMSVFLVVTFSLP